MKRLPVHNLDPAGGTDGQGAVLSGGKFIIGDVGGGTGSGGALQTMIGVFNTGVPYAEGWHPLTTEDVFPYWGGELAGRPDVSPVDWLNTVTVGTSQKAIEFVYDGTYIVTFKGIYRDWYTGLAGLGFSQGTPMAGSDPPSLTYPVEGLSHYFDLDSVITTARTADLEGKGTISITWHVIASAGDLLVPLAWFQGPTEPERVENLEVWVTRSTGTGSGPDGSEPVMSVTNTDGTIDVDNTDATTPILAINAVTEAERVRDVIAAALVAGTGMTVTINDAGNTITVAVNTTTEAERIRDVIGAALVAGTNVTLTVNDAGDTITIDATGGGAGYTDEQVRDVIGAAVVAGTGMTITINDAGDTITFASVGGYTDEQARDAIGAALVAGSGITVTVNDAGDTITIAATAKTSLAILKVSGALATVVGATRLYNDTGRTLTIQSVRASVETPPSGGTVVVDVNVNGTTIFTTQANRPTIASAGTTSGKVTTMDVTTIADGNYFTVDIDTTTSPAADLTVIIAVV